MQSTVTIIYLGQKLKVKILAHTSFKSTVHTDLAAGTACVKRRNDQLCNSVGQPEIASCALGFIIIIIIIHILTP